MKLMTLVIQQRFASMHKLGFPIPKDSVLNTEFFLVRIPYDTHIQAKIVYLRGRLSKNRVSRGPQIIGFTWANMMLALFDLLII